MGLRLRYESLRGEHSYSWRVNVGGRSPGWRGWLACELHRLAMMLDRRWLMLVEVTSDPGLTMEKQREVLRAGIEAMNRHTDHLVRTEAVELAMRAQRPELFKEVQ